jgi:hypothetical protein
VTITTDSRPGIALTAEAGSNGRRDRGSPVGIIRAYAVLLILVPPTHIIGPLGAVGTPATVIGLVALMLWGVAVLTPGGYLVRTVVPVRLVIAMLVGTILSSYAVLHVRHVPGAELLASDRSLLQVLSWAGVALLATEGLRDRGELYRVLRTVVAAVAAMAVVGFLQFRSGIDLAELADRIPGLQANADLVSIQDRLGFRRPAGTATHPIEFGCVIAMALPLALHLARFDLARSPVRRWLPVATIALGIPVAVSRSAVLAAVVAAVVIFVGMDPRLRPSALAAAAVFMVAIYATTPGLLGTLRDLFVHARSDSSITYRTNDYEAVGDYIRQSPWLGRGPGTFLSTTYMVLDNQYLLSAIEIGLVGLSVVLGYLLATALLGRGARHRSREPAIRDLGQALAATSLASAVAVFTFDGFSFLMFAGFIPLCLGVAGALWMMERAAEPRMSVERPPEAERWDPARKPSLVATSDAAAADRSPDDATLGGMVDVSPLVGVPLSDRGGDAGQATHEPSADEELDWLATFDIGPLGITVSSPRGQPEGGSTGDDRADTHDLLRVVALVGAGIAVVVLAVLPFTIDRGANEPDIAVAPIFTPTRPMPTSTSITTPTTNTSKDTSSRSTLRPRTTTTPAWGPDATTTRPSSGDTTAATSSRPTSALSPAAQPTPSPTIGPTATTSPPTVPTTTTTVPPTTTTTVPPTTTTAPPTTTTTAALP